MTVKSVTPTTPQTKEASIQHDTAFQEVLALYEEASGALRAAPDNLEHTDKRAFRIITDAYDAAYDALIAILDANTMHRVCAEVAAARDRQARRKPEQTITPKRPANDASADRKRKQTLFTVRQDFRLIRMDYYAHSENVVIQHLPEMFDTFLDLVEAWPRILEWVRADAGRSFAVSIKHDKEKTTVYTAIDHATGEIHSNDHEVAWWVAAKKG